ncbi:MAG: adenylate/guanylate cyclase domain-containing protein, partial [Flavobacteriales bacterium]
FAHGVIHRQVLKLLDLQFDTDGNLWVATVKNGIICLRDGSFKQYTLTDGIPDETINALGIDHKNRVWAGGYNGKISYFEEGHWNQIDEASFGSHGVVFDFESVDERLYVGCSRGLVAIENLREIGHWNRDNGLPQDFIRDLHSSKTGLWLATYGGGLINWNETGYTQYTRENGMSADQLISLTTDTEGMLWIGSYGSGLMRYLGHTFESNQVSQAHPWSLNDYEGVRLIGTNGEGVWTETENNQFIPSSYTELEERRVYDIYSSENELWFGTDQGVFVYVDGILNRIYNKGNKLPSDDVRCISKGKDQDVLVGTSKGMVIIRNDEFILIDKPEGLSSHDVYEVDYRHDKYWICTNDGLGIWDLKNEGEVHLLNRSSGLASSSVYDISFDDLGTVWIGQYGGGLAYTSISKIDKHLRTGTELEFNFIDETDGLNSNNVEGIVCQQNGTLWVGSEFGLNQLQYNVKEDQVGYKLIGYAQKQGIRDNHICSNNVLITENDEILWCTTTKVLTYDPKDDYFDESAPKIHLQGIDLFYENMDWTNSSDERLSSDFSYWESILGGSIYSEQIQEWSKVPINPVFSFDQNHLTFRYSAINWSRTDQIKYRYRLNNSENDWQPLTSDRKCTYQNIEPGEYTLEVQAMNAEGVWSKSLKYPFEVMSPVWKTIWFRIAVILLALAAIYLIFKWRIKQLKKENLILDVKVKERTQELASEKEKSEELLLNILPRQTAEELKEKGKAVTRNYEKASVLFSDFKGFTKLTETIDAGDLVVQLDSFFRAFDAASDQYRIEKIKTIGDSYMCACGIPRETSFHAHKLVAFGLEMLHITEKLNNDSKSLENWPIRIGIHSGPLIAGVVGMKKFA